MTESIKIYVINFLRPGNGQKSAEIWQVFGYISSSSIIKFDFSGYDPGTPKIPALDWVFLSTQSFDEFDKNVSCFKFEISVIENFQSSCFQIYKYVI